MIRINHFLVHIANGEFVISGEQKRRDFKNLLNKHGLKSLYSKFTKAGVDQQILWDLDDELLDEVRLTGIEKLKYMNAKRNF